MITVADVQNEVPSLISRWRLNDAVGSAMVVDDIGGINLLTVGTPVLSLPSMVKDDVIDTSVLGGVGNYFSAVGVAPYAISHGLTLEGLSAPDPNGNSFSLSSIPGQAQLQLNGLNVVFNIWIGTTLHTLTATGALTGWPQHIVGTYDLVSQLQSIYLDNQLVASQALSGAPGTAVAIGTTGTTSTASKTITAIPTTAGMQIGGVISGAVLPTNSFITAIPSSTSITINAFPNTSGAGKAITVGMPVSIASPTTVASTLAAAQDVAIYGAPLSAQRVRQHFQAFRQILTDPGHVRVYPQIGVYS